MLQVFHHLLNGYVHIRMLVDEVDWVIVLPHLIDYLFPNATEYFEKQLNLHVQSTL